jgi:metacaspase-1
VKNADNYTATITLEKPYKIDNLKAVWVFLKQQNFGNQKISIKIEKFKNTENEKQIRSGLEGLNLVALVDKNPKLIIKEKQNDRGTAAIDIFVAGDNYLYKEVVITNPNDVSKIADQVKNYAQSQFIREMKLEDPKHNIEIEILPATMIDGKYVLKAQKLSGTYLQDGVIPSFQVGDTVVIKVKNKGTEAAYFNILDIQPDGIINSIVPKPGVDGKEYKLDTNQTKILFEKPLRIGPPYGTEIFKVFATKEPINFTPIIGTRGFSKGSGHPLELLLQKTYQSRGADEITITTDEPGTTFEYTFRIVDKRK